MLYKNFVYLRIKKVMEIELNYKKALAEHGIKESELPEDAQIGISVITDSIKMANNRAKGGKDISDKAIKKIKAMDKWVYYEILDFIEDTDDNEDMPYDKKEIIEDIKKEDESKSNKKPNNVNNEQGKGVLIEEELKKLFEANKTQLTLNELKNSARKTYDVIFDSYDPEEENGIETTHYSLIEVEEEEFKLTKK